jgi:hypothetical protein
MIIDSNITATAVRLLALTACKGPNAGREIFAKIQAISLDSPVVTDYEACKYSCKLNTACMAWHFVDKACWLYNEVPGRLFFDERAVDNCKSFAGIRDNDFCEDNTRRLTECMRAFPNSLPALPTLRRVDMSTANVPTLIGKDLSFRDVNQGSIGDCWFLVVLAALAEGGGANFQYIEPFPLADLGTGQESLALVTVTFYDHSLQGVNVQYDPNSNVSGSKKHAPWVINYEAAAVKYLQQNPSETVSMYDGGYPEDAFRMITGYKAMAFLISDLQGLEVLNFIDPSKGFIILASTPPGNDVRDGIVPSHAYAVLSFQDNKVKLYNPWGEGSPTVTVEGATNHRDKGAFSLPLEQFRKYFSSIYFPEKLHSVLIERRFINVEAKEAPAMLIK